MATKDKILYLDTLFSVKSAAEGNSTDESIFIEGYASTNDVDRSRDVVSATVWEKALDNYLKNPIILANHDYDDPIGRMVEHKIDGKGLWIKARISAAAEMYGLIKDGVVTAFSIGFRIIDAEYNSAAEVFIIKEIELIEISVVSVPCNQNTLFNLSKSFSDNTEFTEFKKQFAKIEDTANGLQSPVEAESIKFVKEWDMDPQEIQKMLDDAAAKAAAAAIERAEKAAAEKAAAEKAAKDAEAALEAKIATIVKSTVEVGSSGAERLLADITKRIEEQTESSRKSLEGLEASIAEKAAELTKIQASKMGFTDRNKAGEVDYKERETAVLLGKVTGKGIEGTRFGRDLVEKVGAHMPSATWELEVSTNMEAEVRRKLVVAPLLRGIQMQTNVMTMPINPEAGLATWVTNAQFGTTSSAGSTTTAGPGGSVAAGSPHLLKEITLNAYKVATNEYLAYEEEEDTLLVIMPIVRDAMVRRLARAVDKAYLMGAGAGSDPVKGLAVYDATSVVTPTNTGVATIANLRALRKDLGAWGLDPSQLVYVVSTEVYYDLLDDTAFQTMNQVGPAATLLTGQVGSIGNTPVVVSAEFPTKAGGAATAATNIGAICFAPGNFLAGNQRGLRFDTQELVETQRRVLVASLRTGMVQVTTNIGGGVSTLRWS